ncbi:hypothetical protein LPUS_02994 [Lasallia pustulata]|uniref:Uncharacterized protein n=1 Tax=Lasallia pustulata TaxID=136370 RepID=A0A1W5CTS1_9LECA|nr:hypothetical protein LPUS_02994 [Lasallia pustulata]
MGSGLFNNYADGPALLLPPPQYPFTSASQSPTYAPGNSVRSHVNFSQWTPPSSSTSVTTNPSRKRSRAHSIEDDSYFPANVAPVVPTCVVKPIYGEGMVLINPASGLGISAESQTGTWYEEQQEAERVAAIEAAAALARKAQAPSLPSRKSQRLDSSSINEFASSALLTPASSPTKSGSEKPTIDYFTHLLGVGWSRVGVDNDVRAAARGWAKYIENHYPVTGAEILLQSKGLDACLVGAQQGYFLFKEDLSEGRLVGSNWEICLANLQSIPMAFEGAETLQAAQTPKNQASFSVVETEGVFSNETSVKLDSTEPIAVVALTATDVLQDMTEGPETRMELD